MTTGAPPSPPPERAAFKPTPHPFLPLPDAAQAAALLAQPEGEAALIKLYADREELIRLEAQDPLRHGYEPTSWKRADAQIGWDAWLGLPSGTLTPGHSEMLLLGGNRSSKTEYMCKRAVQLLVKRPRSRVLILHTTDKTSLRDHHPTIYKYLPPEWKTLPKSRVTNISYSQKNGFSENTFVLPNGSQCFFGNYAQDITTIEGGQYDLVLTDELVPLAWVRTLRYRIVTLCGRMLNGFTPIEGFTVAVKTLLSGARTTQSVEAELLPKRMPDGSMGLERVPLVQERRDGAIVYFHTNENPYGGYEALKKTLENKPREEILVRAYGVPTRRMATRFPKFRAEVHVFKLPDLPKRGTRFQVIDPCGGRSFFMGWFLVDESPRGKRIWIYREWPREGGYIPGVGDPGAWAIPGEKEDGDMGPGQTACAGFGLKRYLEEISRLEGWPVAVVSAALEKADTVKRKRSRFPGTPARSVTGPIEGARERVYLRWMDSRFGATPTVREDGTRTLIEDFEDLELYFEPAPGEHLEEGITKINDLLDYDETQPVDSLNAPRLMVCEECPAIIFALENWTGMDGQHGACKDPADIVRYAVLADAEDFEAGTPRGRKGGFR